MRTRTPFLFFSAMLGLSALLCGCGAGVVNTYVEPVQGSSLDPVQGQVYGGHAPIVGAEVFVLQPGVTGYYTKAVDIITNSALPTDSTFGYRYVTTTAGGFFNLNGQYACTPNYPVFLAAYGGNPQTQPAVAITGEAISGTGPYTVKFTNATTNGIVYQGETITFSGLTGTWAYLNGTSQVVLGNTDLTATTFDVSVASNGGNATGSYGVTGLAVQTAVTNNPAIMNLAVLGVCPASGQTNFGSSSNAPISFIYMNEVSTVAAGYALAGFQSGQWYNVGIPAPSGDALALQGIQNAAKTAGNLYDITGGNLGNTPVAGPDFHVARAVTANGNGTVPQYLLDTLGNILANCVDSANTSGTASTQCSTLFSNAKSAGTSGTTPTDIATAIFNIAHNPWANVGTLFVLPTGNVPFLPQLGSAPNDFTVAITYTGGGVNVGGPFYAAVDGSGDVWTTNGASGGSNVSEFSALGVPLSGNTGFVGVTYPYGIAIDTSGNAWVANYLNVGVLTEFNSTGGIARTATLGGLNKPYAVAIDTGGNVWAPNQAGDSLSEFSSTGTVMSGTGFTGSGLSSPRGIAISSSTVYVSNQNNSTPLSVFKQSTGAAQTGLTGGGIASATSVAIDSAGNIWVPNSNPGSNSLTAYTSAGAVLTGSPFTGGGLNQPYYVAIDGANKIFASNPSGNTISEFTNAGAAVTGTGGYVGPKNSGGTSLNNPQDIVIDGSGNLWVANYGGNSVVEFVGVAAPVVTPIVAALNASKYGQKP